MAEGKMVTYSEFWLEQGCDSIFSNRIVIMSNMLALPCFMTEFSKNDSMTDLYAKVEGFLQLIFF